MGILRVNPDKCKPNCGLCVDECPYDVLALDEQTGKAVVKYPQDCTGCIFHFFCEQICPNGAIETQVKINKQLFFAVD